MRAAHVDEHAPGDIARRSMSTVALAAIALATGCLQSPNYRCAHDTDCSDGVCESTGYCSFASDACESGRRYGNLSGALADRCVSIAEPATGTPDAGPPPDAAAIDAAPVTSDAPGCPTGYAPLAGVATHQYRRLPTAAPWVNHKTACASEGAHIHLAIPDDSTEAAAISTLANADVWVGIGDGASEGNFVTVLGATPTYLPWAPGEPDNVDNQDCVAILHATTQFETLVCATTQLVAVCECER